MIDLDKIYTKEEFQKLLSSEYGFLISEYSLKTGSDGYFEYYVPSLADDLGHTKIGENAIEEMSKLSEAGFIGEEECDVGSFVLFKIPMICKIRSEAEDRIWFQRHGFEECKDDEIRRRNMENSKRIARELNIDPKGKMNDFAYGYWSGILSVLRYLSSELYDIDNVRNMDNDILSI